MRRRSVGTFRQGGVLVTHRLLQLQVPQKLLWDPPVGRGRVSFNRALNGKALVASDLYQKTSFD